MKSKDKKVCKICGNIIANPNNKTGICPRCSGKGEKICATVLGGIAGVSLLVRKLIKK